jgi:hypothetical protein
MDINYIVDAKSEYTKQLQTILVPRIYEGIESIYDDAFNNNTANILHTFQKLLREIPKWNKDIIEGETNRIIEVTKCDWLESLITAVFISNTKILTAIKIKECEGKIDISIPRVTHFIHRCYTEVAREIYKNPDLFDKKIKSAKERQQNLRDSLNIITGCIENAIRSLLPIQSLLKEYLGNLNINKDLKNQNGGNNIDDHPTEDQNESDQENKKQKEEEEEQDDEEEQEDEEQEDEEEEPDEIQSVIPNNIQKSKKKYTVNELEQSDSDGDDDIIVENTEPNIKCNIEKVENQKLKDSPRNKDKTRVKNSHSHDGGNKPTSESDDYDPDDESYYKDKNHSNDNYESEDEYTNHNKDISSIKHVKIDENLLPKKLRHTRKDRFTKKKESNNRKHTRDTYDESYIRKGRDSDGKRDMNDRKHIRDSDDERDGKDRYSGGRKHVRDKESDGEDSYYENEERDSNDERNSEDRDSDEEIDSKNKHVRDKDSDGEDRYYESEDRDSNDERNSEDRDSDEEIDSKDRPAGGRKHVGDKDSNDEMNSKDRYYENEERNSNEERDSNDGEYDMDERNGGYDRKNEREERDSNDGEYDMDERNGGYDRKNERDTHSIEDTNDKETASISGSVNSDFIRNGLQKIKKKKPRLIYRKRKENSRTQYGEDIIRREESNKNDNQKSKYNFW